MWSLWVLAQVVTYCEGSVYLSSSDTMNSCGLIFENDPLYARYMRHVCHKSLKEVQQKL